MIKPYTGPASLSLTKLLAQAAVFISLYVLSKPFVRLLLSQGLRQSQHEIRPPWLFLWFSVLCYQARKLWCERESPHSPKVWIQASHVLGCFPEMANSETAVCSSFLLQNSLSCHAIIIPSCQDDASQTSLQNSDKQRRVHLSPSYRTRMPLGLCLCLCSLCGTQGFCVASIWQLPFLLISCLSLGRGSGAERFVLWGIVSPSFQPLVLCFGKMTY